MMKKLIILFMALVATVGAFAGNLSAKRGTVKDSYNFWFYDPADSVQSADAKPLVIFLHGRSLCGHDLNRVKRYGTIDAIDRKSVV